MSAIERATSAQITRRMVVLGAALFAMATPALQALTGLGISQEEFAAEGNQTLQVAGYAFSIWGLIYAALLVYAVRQALPQTGESVLINHMGWPSAISLFGIGLWIIAASANMKWVTVIIITISLLALLVPLLMNSRTIRNTGLNARDRWFLIWPLSALAGWLTIATPLNLITSATAQNVLPSTLSPTTWAILAIVAVVVVGIGVTWALRTLIFSLPIAWGLVGAFVAEQDKNPVLSFTALAAAFALITLSVIISLGLRRTIARER